MAGKEMSIFTKGLIYVLKDFSWWTSTHGIPHIGLANARWLRILWIVVVLACLGGFIWQFIMLVSQYLAYNVNTETAVEAYNTWGNSTSQYGFGSRMDGARQQRATKLSALMSARLYEASKVPGAKHAYTYDDLVISCTYNAKSCHTTDFQEFYDPTYGICQMFNVEGNYSSSRAGPLFGLRMVIRTDQEKYLPWTETAGVVMSIHGKDERPFPDVFGYFAPPGTATSVESCFRDCLQEKIISDCGCYDPAYPHKNDGSTKSCDEVGDTLLNLDCIDRISNADSGAFNIIKDCDCPQPCEVDSYAATVSTAKWPSSSYVPPECNRIPIDVPWVPNGCLEWYKKNTLLVEIYYERMNYQVLSESPAYSLVNLVSDVGGQVGLFLGMSIISLIEIATLILLLLCYCATHKSRKMEIEEIEQGTEKAKEDAVRLAERNRKAANKRKGIYGEDDDTSLPPAVISSN
ncbi:Amiloride-sensitive sodium channel [Necator americanus]|uniref:Amiloride-sensitive sodium channel n=1 Tax=Necator americanus TaxID=51031 RepID=W2T696_NECAM|nr:Amiloride-sensitive sodium channel [Necator americanus]ETN76502.1 Amiloride-sensitive sodium channel [Necator americanus]